MCVVFSAHNTRPVTHYVSLENVGCKHNMNNNRSFMRYRFLILDTLRVSENMVLRRIFGPRRDEVMGEWRRLA